ncbi:MAG TPA: tRNA adenosine(34) deaminase TadA [Pseudomonadales bacterium]|nr:tRNA adenosine(34) deaminase TadA [Pseudomonadales bacterium]
MNQQDANDEQWMTHALILAMRAWDMDEVPVGAVLVANNQIIGQGWNRPIGDHDPTAHAEIVALREGANKMNNYRLPGTTLYVTLEPCAMCVGALLHARIDRLVFGAREGKNGAIVSQLSLLELHVFNHIFHVREGVMTAQASELLSAFFKRKRILKKTKANRI